MHFEEDYTYHIYNRSNELIFIEKINYLYFLEKLRELILPYVNIFAYCLLPNHFHLMLSVKSSGVSMINECHRPNTQILSKQLGILLSSYTQAINMRFNRKGSLFAHKTKAKQLNNFGDFKNINQRNYSLICFNYIHNNPLSAGLVDNLVEWEFSSYKDYLGLRNGTLINKDLASNILNFDLANLCKYLSYGYDEKDIRDIF